MAKAFAINTVHVCRSPGETKDGKVTKPAKVEIVPAGNVFDVDQATFDELEKVGAVRTPTRKDRALAAEGDDDLDAVEVQAGQHLSEAAPAASTAAAKAAAAKA